MLFLTRLYKPLWVPVDDVAAQLSPKFQSQQSKSLEVMTQKVVKPSPTTAVIFIFHRLC
jgi:hypothetical protein